MSAIDLACYFLDKEVYLIPCFMVFISLSVRHATKSYVFSLIYVAEPCVMAVIEPNFVLLLQ